LGGFDTIGKNQMVIFFGDKWTGGIDMEFQEKWIGDKIYTFASPVFLNTAHGEEIIMS
jgi:hypothetical protein